MSQPANKALKLPVRPVTQLKATLDRLEGQVEELSGVLLPLGVFVAMAVVMIGGPVILGVGIAREWAIVNALRRRVRVLHGVQAVLMFSFAVSALFFASELKWFMVGLGVIGAAGSILQLVFHDRWHHSET